MRRPVEGRWRPKCKVLWHRGSGWGGAWCGLAHLPTSPAECSVSIALPAAHSLSSDPSHSLCYSVPPYLYTYFSLYLECPGHEWWKFTFMQCLIQSFAYKKNKKSSLEGGGFCVNMKGGEGFLSPSRAEANVSQPGIDLLPPGPWSGLQVPLS